LREELKHTFVLGIGTGISSLLRIAYIVFVGRTLGPEQYAVFYSALTCVMLFSTALAPVSGTVSRFTSLFVARGDDAALNGLWRFARAEVARLAILVLTIGSIALLVAGRQLGWGSWVLTLIVALTLPVALLLELPRGLLRGALEFVPYGSSLVIEAALRLALAVVIILPFTSAATALGAYLAAAIVAWPIANSRADKRANAPESSLPDAPGIRRFAIRLFAVATIGALLQNVDVLAVKALFGDRESGLYSAAASLAKSVGLVFLPFGTFLLPTLTERFSRGERLVAPLLRTMALFAVPSILAISCFSWIGSSLIQILYGEEFLGARPLLVPLATAMLFALLSVMIGQAFTACDRFGFVPIYGASLIAVFGALWWGRTELSRLASALVASQIFVFGVMLAVFLIVDSRATDRSTT